MLVLAALVAAGACSGNTETGPGPSSPVPVEQLPARIASAICDNIGPCCTRSGYVSDAALCRQSLEAELGQNLADSLANRAVTYDAVEAGRCVDAFAAVVRTCVETNDSTEEACSRVFKGTLPEGAACTDSEECIDPPGRYAYCEEDLATGGARCVTYSDVSSPTARGRLGDACAGTCTSDPDGSTGCSGGVPIPSPGTGGTAGMAPVPGDATCWTSDGIFCDTATYLCTPLIAIGQACLYEGCVAGAFCENGLCAAQRTSGPCLSFDACAATAYCDATSNCAPKKPDGSACEFSDECAGGRCNENAVCAEDTVASQELCSGILD